MIYKIRMWLFNKVSWWYIKRLHEYRRKHYEYYGYYPEDDKAFKSIN